MLDAFLKHILTFSNTQSSCHALLVLFLLLPACSITSNDNDNNTGISDAPLDIPCNDNGYIPDTSDNWLHQLHWLFGSSSEEDLVTQVSPFLAAIQNADIATARKLAQPGALSAFLSLDIAAINNYAIVNCELMKRTAIIELSINDEQDNIQCFFKRKKGRWLFSYVNLLQ